MELKIGDIVKAFHKSLPKVSSNPVLYKVIKLRNDDNTIPTVIERLSDQGDRVETVKDIWNDWHNYTWIVHTRTNDKPLSEADKKYEKIIIKIRTLDNKFKLRKELK